MPTWNDRRWGRQRGDDNAAFTERSAPRRWNDDREQDRDDVHAGPWSPYNGLARDRADDRRSRDRDAIVIATEARGARAAATTGSRTIRTCRVRTTGRIGARSSRADRRIAGRTAGWGWATGGAPRRPRRRQPGPGQRAVGQHHGPARRAVGSGRCRGSGAWQREPRYDEMERLWSDIDDHPWPNQEHDELQREARGEQYPSHTHGSWRDDRDRGWREERPRDDRRGGWNEQRYAEQRGGQRHERGAPRREQRYERGEPRYGEPAPRRAARRAARDSATATQRYEAGPRRLARSARTSGAATTRLATRAAATHADRDMRGRPRRDESRTREQRGPYEHEHPGDRGDHRRSTATAAADRRGVGQQTSCVSERHESCSV